MQMDDADTDDFLGAVIDFGDGKQYTVAPSEVLPTTDSTGVIPNSATSQDRLGDDFDRSWPPRPSPGAPSPRELPSPSPSSHLANAHVDGRGLFNERSNRVEPYSRESRFPQRTMSGSHQHPPGKGGFREAPPHGSRDQESSGRFGGEFPPHERDRDTHGSRRPSYADRERERNSYRRDDDHFNGRGRMGPPPPGRGGDYHPHGHPPGYQSWDNRSTTGRSRRGSQASSTAPYAASVRDHSRESTRRNRSRETNAGDRQMPPHLRAGGRPSVGPVTSPSSLNARAGGWRTSPTVPTRPPPGPSGGSYGPPSSAGSYTGRGRLNSDVSSRGTGEPTAGPGSNQSLHATPLVPALGDPGVDPDVMHKTAMAEAAERARKRRQEEEEEREKERERARKKAEEVEAKIKAKEEEERKKKEAEEEGRRKAEREEKERERKEREEQQKGKDKDAQRPAVRLSISNRADSWRTKAAPLPPLPNKPTRAPSVGINGTTATRGVPVTIIHEVAALDMNHGDLEVVDFANMGALVGAEKDSSPAQENATLSDEIQPTSGKLSAKPETPLKSDGVSNWRKAPTVTEPEASPKAADAKIPSATTSPTTSTLPLPPKNLASGGGKSLRPSPLTLVDNHVSRASNIRRTSQEGSHLVTVHTPTQPLHSPRTPKTGEFVPYREAPISVLDDTMSRFKEALLQSNPSSAKLDGSMIAAMEEGPNGHGISASKSPTGLAFSILNRTKPAPNPSELRSALSKAAEKVEKTETKSSNDENLQEGTAGDTGDEAWTQTQEPLSATPPGSDVQPTINIPAQSTKKESISSKRINAAKSNQQWRWDTLTLNPPMPAMSKKTLSVIDVLMPSGGPNKKPVVKVPTTSRPSSPATLIAAGPSVDAGKKPKKDQKDSTAPACTPWASKKGGSEEAVWRRGVPVQGPAKKGSAAQKSQEMQLNEPASTASTAGSSTASAAPVSMTITRDFACSSVHFQTNALSTPANPPSTLWGGSSPLLTISESPLQPPSPSSNAAKALWTNDSTSETVPTKNSLKDIADIADELPPVMPQSVAEVKAEDGEPTKKTPPLKFDPYKAFQTVPTQSQPPASTPPPPIPPSPRRNNSDNIQRQTASPARPRLGPSASAPSMRASSPMPVRPFPVQGAAQMYPAPQVPMTGAPAYGVPAYAPPVPPSPMMSRPGHAPMAGWSPQVVNSPAQMMRPLPYGQPTIMNYQPGPPQTPQTQPMFLPSSPAMVPKSAPMPMRQRGLSNSMQAPGTPQQQPQQQMSPYPYMIPIPPTPGIQPVPLHMQGRIPSQQQQPMHPPQPPPQGQHPQAPMQMQMQMGMGMQVSMNLQPPPQQPGSMFPQPPPHPHSHFGRSW